MKSDKLFIIISVLSLILFSSCASFVSQKSLMNIQKGMTKHEVEKIFGQPDYRRFDNRVEEWEYYRTVGMNSTVIIVDFEDDLVISMNSFPDVSQPTKPSVDIVPGPYPVDRPDYIGNTTAGSNYRGGMSDRDFNQFYLSVKNETFNKDQMLKIETASKKERFTCRQCTKIMSLYTFDDDKMKVIQFLAPSLVDRENSYIILDSMTFSSNKDKVRYLLDSFKRN